MTASSGSWATRVYCPAVTFFGGTIIHWTLCPFLTMNGLGKFLLEMVEMGFLYGATLTAHTDGCLLVVTDVTGLDVVTGALEPLAVITVLITDTGLHFSCCTT